MNKDKLVVALVVDEGKRAKIYTDTVGKITGGVGRNLSDREFFDDEIMLMLNNDIAVVEKDLDKHCPWWRFMTEARQNVLANMCFNMGAVRLLGFKNTLALMQARDYENAAKEMLNSLWAKQVGERSQRLATLMTKGEFQ